MSSVFTLSAPADVPFSFNWIIVLVNLLEESLLKEENILGVRLFVA